MKKVNKKDLLVMKLLHYFITNKNYNPIILHGLENEIWLENPNEQYRIIRLVMNYIHNNEQYNFDVFKTKRIIKKIKMKTFSLKANTLSLYFDLSDYVELNEEENIEALKVKSEKDIVKSKKILEIFSDIKDNLNFKEKGLELYTKITSDLNKKNEKETKQVNDIFKEKKSYVTYGLIFLNVLIFSLLFIINPSLTPDFLASFGGLINDGKIYRIFTSIFLHSNLIHIFFNMYVLYILGKSIENYYNHYKFLFIYLYSGIIASLVSLLFLGDYTVSVGASGAIFGLLGAFLYFGMNFRNILGNSITKNIISILLINLLIGVFVSGIDLYAHIGGFIGGLIASNAVGIKYKTSKSDKINGSVVAVLALLLLIYVNFIK